MLLFRQQSKQLWLLSQPTEQHQETQQAHSPQGLPTISSSTSSGSSHSVVAVSAGNATSNSSSRSNSGAPIADHHLATGLTAIHAAGATAATGTTTSGTGMCGLLSQLLQHVTILLHLFSSAAAHSPSHAAAPPAVQTAETAAETTGVPVTALQHSVAASTTNEGCLQP